MHMRIGSYQSFKDEFSIFLIVIIENLKQTVQSILQGNIT